MSKKKNEQPEAAEKLNKKSNTPSKKEKEQKNCTNEYTITASLVDCTYCEELQKQVKEYEEELKIAKDAIKAQRRSLERLTVINKFYTKCAEWAEDHLGYFARRKYTKVCSEENLADLIKSRCAKNLGHIEADEDAQMLKELHNFGCVFK